MSSNIRRTFFPCHKISPLPCPYRSPLKKERGVEKKGKVKTAAQEKNHLNYENWKKEKTKYINKMNFGLSFYSTDTPFYRLYFYIHVHLYIYI